MFTQAVNKGVPSKLGKWKIFNKDGEELTEVKPNHLDDPPQVSSGIKHRRKIILNKCCLATNNIHHTNQFCLFQTNLRWKGTKKANFKGWLHLYGTEADPTDITIKYLQWGSDDDANMLSCGMGGV